MASFNYRTYSIIFLFFVLMLSDFVSAAEGKVLRVRGDKNFAPYEYIDSKGRPAGFNIDVVTAVAREMGLELDIHLGTWDEVRQELINKEIDMLTGVLRSKERESYFDFSIPHSMVSYSLFVRKDSMVQSKEDLIGKEIIVHAEAYSHDWLKKEQMTQHIISIAESDEAMRLLASGKHDCALIERISGLETLRRLNIDNVISLGPPVLPRKYCFAVAEGNYELKSILDEGFYNIYKSGEYDRIFRKWFSVYENRLMNVLVIKYAASGILAFIVILILVFCWNIGLKRAVDRRTLELRESDRKFRELADLLPEIVFEVNRDGAFEFINRNGLTSLGYTTAEKSEDRNIYSLFDVDSRENVKNDISAALDGKVSEPEEYTAIRKDGTTFPVFLYYSPIMRSEKVIGLRCILVDISRIQELENQIQQTRKMETLGRMAGGIAHDFNNLLTGINGYIQLALRKIRKDEKADDNLVKALDACSLAGDLVRHIHVFSRQITRRVSSVNLGLIIEEVIKLLSHTFPANVTMNYDISSDHYCIPADPTQVHQVVMNLCINSSHAMGNKGGVLDISLKEVEVISRQEGLLENIEPGTYFEISVSDTGVGIEPELMEKIFEPYFTTKDPDAGTGLGLSVVKDIVKNIGGNIVVESTPGEGATFKVLFPVSNQSITDDKVNVSEKLSVVNANILIADDEDSQVEIERNVLESIGYNVTIKRSGLDALNAFMEAPDSFDLVIADHHTPGLTGIELTKRILDIKPSLPVVLCTGFTDPTAEEKATEIGVRRFLKKPLVKDQVSKTIQEALKPM